MNPLLERAQVLEEKVRRVRTAAGAEHYGQPIGSVIVPDAAGPVRTVRGAVRAAQRTNGSDGSSRTPRGGSSRQRATGGRSTGGSASPTRAKKVESDYDGWEKYEGEDGNSYYVGQEAGKWTLADDQDYVLFAHKDKPPVISRLDKHIEGRTKKPVRQSPSTDDDTLEITSRKYAGTTFRLHKATDEERKNFVKNGGSGGPIPPAWTNVYIADDFSQALHAIGTDAAGRKQYRYSADHSKTAAASKFKRTSDAMKVMKKLDDALRRDYKKNDTAAALFLIRRMGMRPGSDRDTKAEKKAFGATNLQARHVKVTPGGQTNFAFTGKKGVDLQLKTKDPIIAEIISERLKTKSRNDRLFETDEAKVNEYLKKHIGDEYKAKDLRTIHGTAIALAEVKKKRGKPKTPAELKRWQREVAVTVAAQLGNTPTVALGSYINPMVFDEWKIEGAK